MSVSINHYVVTSTSAWLVREGFKGEKKPQEKSLEDSLTIRFSCRRLACGFGK